MRYPNATQAILERWRITDESAGWWMLNALLAIVGAMLGASIEAPIMLLLIVGGTPTDSMLRLIWGPWPGYDILARGRFRPWPPSIPGHPDRPIHNDYVRYSNTKTALTHFEHNPDLAIGGQIRIPGSTQSAHPRSTPYAQIRPPGSPIPRWPNPEIPAGDPIPAYPRSGHRHTPDLATGGQIRGPQIRPIYPKMTPKWHTPISG